MKGDAHARGVIGEIVRRLVAGYAPRRVILFGSHAYGEPDEDSDIDLLIIADTTEGFLQRMDSVRRLATGAHPRIPFEPIVLTPGEVGERVRVGDQFVQEILERGEVLFAA